MPVLLGAGVVLSAIAYVVERIAEATALPLLDRRLARRYESIALPANGLLGAPRHRTRPQPGAVLRAE